MRAPALLLRLDLAGRTIAYTGDTAWTGAIADAAADADLLIAEAYYRDKNIPYHLRLAPRAVSPPGPADRSGASSSPTMFAAATCVDDNYRRRSADPSGEFGTATDSPSPVEVIEHRPKIDRPHHAEAVGWHIDTVFKAS